MTIERAINLWRSHRDRRAEAVIIRHYGRIVASMANNTAKVSSVMAGYEDLNVMGMAAVFKAVETFDETRGATIDTHITNGVKYTMLHAIRDSSQFGRYSFNFRSRALSIQASMTTALGREPDIDELLAELLAQGLRISDQGLKIALAGDFDPVSFSNITPGGDRVGIDADYESIAMSFCSGSTIYAQCPSDVLIGHSAVDIMSTIDELPSSWSRTLKAILLEGRSQKEVSAIAGVSQMQVSRYYRRGLDAIRRSIETRNAADVALGLAV